MKNLLLVFALLATFSLQLKADGADLFDINEDQVKSEMAELDALEDFVNQNEGVTLETLQTENNPLAVNITPNEIGITSLAGSLSPQGNIGSFFWGFCLGPIGVVVVYFIDKDNIMMAIVGCLVSSLIGGGYGILMN